MAYVYVPMVIKAVVAIGSCMGGLIVQVSHKRMKDNPKVTKGLKINKNMSSTI